MEETEKPIIEERAFTVILPEELYKLVKFEAVKQNKPAKEIVTEAIKKFFNA